MLTRLFTIALAAAGIAIGALPASTAHAFVQLPTPSHRPAPPPGYTYRWVPPQYRTEIRRVWIEGRTEWVVDWIYRNGHYEQVWRPAYTPGRWEERAERIQIRPGYWQLVRIDPPPPPPIYPRPYPMPRPWQGVPTVGVDGYNPQPAEDLSKFSPLHEWPSR